MTVAALKLHAETTPTLPRFGAKADVKSVANALSRDGAVIIENVIAPDQLKQIRRELSPWFGKALSSEGQFYGRSTSRFGALFSKAKSTWGLGVHPVVLPAIESVLTAPRTGGPDTDMVDLSCTQAISIGPGEIAQFMHRDEELWPFPKTYEVTAIVMWTLTDFTRQNGATRIIPGSHLWPRDRSPEPGEAAYAEAPAGSAIIWLGGTMHGGGANATNECRLGLATAFKLGWLAPQEKLLLTVPPSVARQMPERLQRLIGYQVHRPALGLIEGRDPIEWLHGQIGDVAAAADNLTPAHDALLADISARPEQYLGYMSA
jgi:Phytanoyl-CoA dioxygenase (PhyH)